MSKICAVVDRSSDAAAKSVLLGLAPLGNVSITPAESVSATLLRSAAPDLVFVGMHSPEGTRSRSEILRLLESTSLPLTGSSADAVQRSDSRLHLKEALAAVQIAAPAGTVVTPATDLEPLLKRSFPLAVFSSPDTTGGVDRGIMVEDQNDLRSIADRLWKAKGTFLVEPFSTGAHFACVVLGNGDEATILPPVSILPTAVRVDHVPMGLDDAIERMVLGTYRALQLIDIARIDVALTETGIPQVVAVDALPDLVGGFGNPVLLAADALGVDGTELVQRIAVTAGARQGIAFECDLDLEDLKRRTPPRGLRLRTRLA